MISAGRGGSADTGVWDVTVSHPPMARTILSFAAIVVIRIPKFFSDFHRLTSADNLIIHKQFKLGFGVLFQFQNRPGSQGQDVFEWQVPLGDLNNDRHRQFQDRFEFSRHQKFYRSRSGSVCNRRHRFDLEYL